MKNNGKTLEDETQTNESNANDMLKMLFILLILAMAGIVGGSCLAWAVVQ